MQSNVSIAVYFKCLLGLEYTFRSVFFVVVNHNFAIVIFFSGRSKAKGLGVLNQTPFFYIIFVNSLFLKKCESVLMFWIPYASNNRASMFELIKNFLSPITTLNGQIIEPGDEEV